MRKIESLFEREGHGKKFLAVPRFHPECLWVPGTSQMASAKIDGTACLLRDGRLYKRLDLKLGKEAPGWIHWTFDPAQKSGHGWFPVGDGPEDAWHREAFANPADYCEGATYELVGPRIQKNPHDLERHELWRHGAILIGVEVPSDPQAAFDHVRYALDVFPYEGIVWHDKENDRYAKIKRRDFSLPWPLPRSPADEGSLFQQGKTTGR